MASATDRSGPSLGDRLLRLYAGLVYLFLFAPIIVVVISSFNPSGRSDVPKGFTMRWYADLMVVRTGGRLRGGRGYRDPQRALEAVRQSLLASFDPRDRIDPAST